MPQIARPDGIYLSQVGTWSIIPPPDAGPTTTTLWNVLDEPVANDGADYIFTFASTQCQLTLDDSITDPHLSVGHKLRIRAWGNWSGAAPTIEFRLSQSPQSPISGKAIATSGARSFAAASTWETLEFTLTSVEGPLGQPAEADNIDSYALLYVQLVATVPSGAQIRISQVEFEAPDPVLATPSPAVANWQSAGAGTIADASVPAGESPARWQCAGALAAVAVAAGLVAGRWGSASTPATSDGVLAGATTARWQAAGAAASVAAPAGLVAGRWVVPAPTASAGVLAGATAGKWQAAGAGTAATAISPAGATSARWLTAGAGTAAAVTSPAGATSARWQSALPGTAAAAVSAAGPTSARWLTVEAVGSVRVDAGATAAHWIAAGAVTSVAVAAGGTFGRWQVAGSAASVDLPAGATSARWLAAIPGTAVTLPAGATSARWRSVVPATSLKQTAGETSARWLTAGAVASAAPPAGAVAARWRSAGAALSVNPVVGPVVGNWRAADPSVATNATPGPVVARWLAADPHLDVETIAGEGYAIFASWVAPGASITGGGVSAFAESAVMRVAAGPPPPTGPTRVGLPGWVDTGITRFFDAHGSVLFQNYGRRKTVIGIDGWELSQFIPIHSPICLFPGSTPSTVAYVQDIRIQPPGGGIVVIDRITWT